MAGLGLKKLILEAAGLTVEDLQKYKINPEKVSGVQIMIDTGGVNIPAGLLPPTNKRAAPLVTVNSDYFDQYLEETLKDGGINYQFVEEPYRHIIFLDGAKFFIVDDTSFAKYKGS